MHNGTMTVWIRFWQYFIIIRAYEWEMTHVLLQVQKIVSLIDATQNDIYISAHQNVPDGHWMENATWCGFLKSCFVRMQNVTGKMHIIHNIDG